MISTNLWKTRGVKNDTVIRRRIREAVEDRIVTQIDDWQVDWAWIPEGSPTRIRRALQILLSVEGLL